MSENLKLQITGALDKNKSIESINKNIKELEKSSLLKDLKLNITVDNNALNVLKNFSKQMEKIKAEALGTGKYIEEVLNPDGSKSKRTWSGDLAGEFRQTDTAAKPLKATLEQQAKSVEELRRKYSLLIKEVDNYNAKGKKIGSTLSLANTDKSIGATVKLDANGELISYKETNKQSEILSKNTTELISKISRLHTEGKITSAQFKELSKSVQGLGTTTGINSINKKMNDYTLATKNATKSAKDYVATQEQIRKLTNSIVSAQNKNPSTLGVNTNVSSMLSTLQQIDPRAIGASKAVKGVSDSFDRLKASSTSAGRDSMSMLSSLKIALQKFPIWMLSSTLFFGVTRSIATFGNVIVDVDTKMTSLYKVMSETTDFEGLFDRATQSSENFGQSISSSLDAYTEFAKQGYKELELGKLADSALVASNVGEITAQQASEYMTASLVQWKRDASESMDIISSWNEISNNYATTTEKLAQGQARAGATARAMGLDFDQLNAIVGTVTASTKQSGNEVGNFVKAVLPRLTGAPAKKALESLGISLTDQNGNLRDVIQIYTDVAEAVKGITDTERIAVTEGLAGKFHISRMQALLDDLGQVDSMYRQMYDSSVNSTGSAMNENEIYMESLQARINLAKVEVEKLGLAMGEAFMTESMIQGIKVFSDFLGVATKVTNSIGALPVVLGLGGVAVFALSSRFRTLVSALASGTTGMTVTRAATVGLATDMTRASVATGVLGISLKGLLLSTGVGAILVGIGFAIEKLLGAMGKARETEEALKQENDALIESYNSSGEAIQELATKYSTLSEAMSKGNLDENGKYDTKKAEEYVKVQSELAQLMPELKIGETAYGEAILLNSDLVDKRVAQAKELAEALQLQQDIENQEKSLETIGNLESSVNDNEKSIKRLLRTINHFNQRGTIKGDISSLEQSYELLSALEKQFEADRLKMGLDVGDTSNFHLNSLQSEIDSVKSVIQDMATFSSMISTDKQKINNETMKSALAAIRMNDLLTDSEKSVATNFASIVGIVETDSKKIASTISNLENEIETPEFGDLMDEYDKLFEKMGNPDISSEELTKTQSKIEKVISSIITSLKGTTELDDSTWKSIEAQFVSLLSPVSEVDKALLELSQTTGKSMEELRNNLATMYNNDVSAMIEDTDEYGESISGVTEELIKYVNNLRELSSAQEQILGVSSSQISETQKLAYVYGELSAKANLTSREQELLSQTLVNLSAIYPELNSLMKSTNASRSSVIEMINKEMKANEDLLTVIEAHSKGKLSAEEQMTYNSAMGTKSRLENAKQELIALAKLVEAYNKFSQDAANKADSLRHSNPNMSEDYEIQARKFAGFSREQAKKTIDFTENVNALISEMNGHTGSVLTSMAANEKLAKSNEKVSKSTKDSIYFTDKYKNSVELLTLALEKQNAIKAKYPSHSKEHQNAIKAEIALTEQLKKATEDQAKSLESQIKSGKIAPTGLVTTSSGSSSSGGSGSNKASGNSTEANIWNFFKGKGLSDGASAGILGNLKLESGLSTTAVNKSSGATGIAQWLGGRLTGLKKYAETLGTSWTDLNTQLEWLWKELNGADSTTKSILNKNGGLSALNNMSASSAALLFEKAFERSGGAALTQRKNNANDYYSKFNGSVGSETFVSDSSSEDSASTKAAQISQAIDQAKSELNGLYGNVIGYEEKLNTLKAELINAELDTFSFQKKQYQHTLDYESAKQEAMSKTGKEYRASIDKQIVAMIGQQSANQAELDFLNDLIKNGNLSAIAMTEMKEKVKALKVEMLQLNTSIQNTNFEKITSRSQAFDESQDDLQELIDLSIEYAKTLEEGSKEYVAESEKQIALAEKQQRMTNAQITEWKEYLKTMDLAPETIKEINEQLEDLEKSSATATNSIREMNEALSQTKFKVNDDAIQDTQDKIDFLSYQLGLLGEEDVDLKINIYAEMQTSIDDIIADIDKGISDALAERSMAISRGDSTIIYDDKIKSYVSQRRSQLSEMQNIYNNMQSIVTDATNKIKEAETKAYQDASNAIDKIISETEARLSVFTNAVNVLERKLATVQESNFADKIGITSSQLAETKNSAQAIIAEYDRIASTPVYNEEQKRQVESKLQSLKDELGSANLQILEYTKNLERTHFESLIYGASQSVKEIDRLNGRLNKNLELLDGGLMSGMSLNLSTESFVGSALDLSSLISDPLAVKKIEVNIQDIRNSSYSQQIKDAEDYHDKMQLKLEQFQKAMMEEQIKFEENLRLLTKVQDEAKKKAKDESNKGIVDSTKKMATEELSVINTHYDNLQSAMKMAMSLYRNEYASIWDGIIADTNAKLSTLESNVSKANSISTSVSKSPPKYANGTNGHHGGLAIVGDGNKEELILFPDGQVGLSDNKDQLVNLPRGTQVISGDETQSILNGKNIPKYAKGTGGLSEAYKSAGYKIDESEIGKLLLDNFGDKGGMQVQVGAGDTLISFPRAELGSQYLSILSSQGEDSANLFYDMIKADYGKLFPEAAKIDALNKGIENATTEVGKIEAVTFDQHRQIISDLFANSSGFVNTNEVSKYGLYGKNSMGATPEQVKQFGIDNNISNDEKFKAVLADYTKAYNQVLTNNNKDAISQNEEFLKKQLEEFSNIIKFGNKDGYTPNIHDGRDSDRANMEKLFNVRENANDVAIKERAIARQKKLEEDAISQGATEFESFGLKFLKMLDGSVIMRDDYKVVESEGHYLPEYLSGILDGDKLATGISDKMIRMLAPSDPNSQPGSNVSYVNEVEVSILEVLDKMKQGWQVIEQDPISMNNQISWAEGIENYLKYGSLKGKAPSMPSTGGGASGSGDGVSSQKIVYSEEFIKKWNPYGVDGSNYEKQRQPKISEIDALNAQLDLIENSGDETKIATLVEAILTKQRELDQSDRIFIIDSLTDLSQQRQKVAEETRKTLATELRDGLASGTLSEEAINRLRDGIASAESDLSDAQLEEKKLFGNKFSSQQSNRDVKLDELKKVEEALQRTLDLSESIDDTDYAKSLSQLKKINDSNVKYTDELKSQKKSLEEQLKLYPVGTYEWNLINAQVEDYTGKIHNAEIATNGLVNQMKSTADNIINIIKKAYEKQRDIAIATIDDTLSELDKKYNEMTKKIDKAESDRDYNRSLEEQQKKQLELQKKINILSLDNSQEAIAKRLELQKELGTITDEIAEMQHDRAIELEKKAIQEEYELRKDKLEKEKEDINYHYDDLMENEKHFADLRESIVSGNTAKVKELLGSFLSEFELTNVSVAEQIGVSFQSLLSLIEEVKKAYKGIDVNLTDNSSIDTAIKEKDTETKNNESGKHNSSEFLYAIVDGKSISVNKNDTEFIKRLTDAGYKLSEYDSSKKDTSDNTSNNGGYDLETFTSAMNAFNFKKGEEAIAWLDKNHPELKRFNTGGYTGDSEGVAYLDKKELVLDKFDTKNILDAVRLATNFKLPKFNLPKISLPNGNNGENAPINYNLTLNIDKLNGTRKEGEGIATTIISTLRKMGK